MGGLHHSPRPGPSGSTNGGTMRILWKLVKIIIGIAIAIPLGIVAIALALGVLGGLFGIAVLVLKFAFLGLIAYGMFRAARFFLAPARKPDVQPVRELPMPDPYYEAAMRELDAEMGHNSRR